MTNTPPMKPTEERQFLLGVLRRIETPHQTFLESSSTIAILGVVLVGLIALPLLTSLAQPLVMLLALVAAAVGGALAFVYTRRYSWRTWPALSRHMSRASIQERLLDLES